jgi:hypothetical protein
VQDEDSLSNVLPWHRLELMRQSGIAFDRRKKPPRCCVFKDVSAAEARCNLNRKEHAMAVHTCLEPLSTERAEELFGMLTEARDDESRAIALDDAGRVTGLVDVEHNAEEHLIADLDVHA